MSKEDIDYILKIAEKLEPYARGVQGDLLSGKLFAMLFYEPSTRTRLSFETATKRLGGDVIGFSSPESSSFSKGESLADTIRVVSGYADAIILRHPKEGAALFASQYSTVPLINAGDGAGHHPTQTLLDLYTLHKESTLEGVKIALVGDLKYGRTVHSLVYALSLYNAKIFLVSPPELSMPSHVVSDILERGATVHETASIEDVIEEVDAVYMTRIQKERFPDPSEYQRVVGSYRLTPELLKMAKPTTIVMHPLPRVDEIDPAVDNMPNAKYFQQSFYGVPVRMAVLCILMEVFD